MFSNLKLKFNTLKEKFNQKTEYFQKRALDAIYSEKKSTEPSPAFLNIALVTFIIFLLAKSGLHAEEVTGEVGPGVALDTASRSVLCTIKGALGGWTGWVLIAIGMLLAIWDYFIQKQGYILIGAILGVIALIVLRMVLPDCKQASS